MDFAWHGDLLSHTQKFKMKCNWSKVLNIDEQKNLLSQITSVASALSSIHYKKVCHRDIKPHNIVIDSNQCIKLIDFGVSKILKDEDFKSTTTGIKGTFHFRSPELFMKKSKDVRFLDLFAADMWALGVTIYYCLYSNYPFDAKS